MSEYEIEQLQERHAMPEFQYIEKRNEILANWEHAKTELQKFRELEMQSRIAFIQLTSDRNKVVGTENIELSNGYKAKIVKKQTYIVDQENVSSVLIKLESVDDEGKAVADRIIKWKAELSKTEYDNLSEYHKKIIDEIISINHSTPTLEIIPPKSKKQL